jgi:hypothetical protein
MVIKDTSGYVFGGFTCETWKKSTKFYGTGESFLFTLKNGNEPIVFRWTGENDQIQWANENSLGIGGGTSGRFGLFIKDNFFKGSCSKTSTFDNDILSSKPDFTITLLEVWAFE